MIDIVKEPKTAQEAFDLWKEWQSGKANLKYGKRIQVLDMGGTLTQEAVKWHHDRMVKLYGKDWKRNQEENDE